MDLPKYHKPNYYEFKCYSPLVNYKDMKIYDSLFELPKKLEEFALELPKIHTELAARVGLKERNSRAKRRLHTGNEFKFLVNQLIVESYSNMTSMTTEEWAQWEFEQRCAGIVPDRRTAHASHWAKSLIPAITCIVQAAWPQWFNSQDHEHALRKVRSAWPKDPTTRKPYRIYLAGAFSPTANPLSVKFIRDMINSRPPIR